MGPGGSYWTEERKALLWLCRASPGESGSRSGRIELASFGKLKGERASVRADSVRRPQHISRTPAGNNLNSQAERIRA